MIDEGRLRRLEADRAAAGPAPFPAGPAVVPNVVEFATGADYLDQDLYPRQATWLKLMCCSPTLLTAYDDGVIAEWTAGFTPSVHSDGTAGYNGTYGIVPDVLRRVQFCLDQGRGWFREVVVVGGRRGSKGFIGAVVAAYVLWHQLAIEDPRRRYGIARGKQVHLLVFAGQRDQAVTNQWRDLSEMIRSAPCFQPFIAKQGRDSISLFSAAQVAAGGASPDDAMFVISAKEATQLAGRGPAVICEIFDEMAHMVAGGANRSAEEIFSAATPALRQFGKESLLYEASSPWHQQGQFHTNYRRGLAIDPDTGDSLDPDMLVIQVPSHELYRDWELTREGEILCWPGGLPLPALEKAIVGQADMEQERRADPVRFDVEFDAQWATSVAAYLRPEDVDSIFAEWDGQALGMRSEGVLGTRYVAHADPSVSGANFAVMVAHRGEDHDGRGHVVVDYIRVWRPADFPDGRVDYEAVAASLESLMLRFRISSFSFDQFSSAGLMDRLRAFAQANQLHSYSGIHERTGTASLNKRMYEGLKTALSRRIVHAPHHELLEAELRNLETRNGRVDHPTRGPVQTSDIADCLMNVVDVLIGDNNGEQFAESLGTIMPSGSVPGHPLSERFDRVHTSQKQGLQRGRHGDAARGSRFGRRG